MQLRAVKKFLEKEEETSINSPHSLTHRINTPHIQNNSVFETSQKFLQKLTNHTNTHSKSTNMQINPENPKFCQLTIIITHLINGKLSQGLS